MPRNDRQSISKRLALLSGLFKLPQSSLSFSEGSYRAGLYSSQLGSDRCLVATERRLKTSSCPRPYSDSTSNDLSRTERLLFQSCSDQLFDCYSRCEYDIRKTLRLRRLKTLVLETYGLQHGHKCSCLGHCHHSHPEQMTGEPHEDRRRKQAFAH